MTHPNCRRSVLTSAILTLAVGLAWTSTAAAQLPVFAGDPVEPTSGIPYAILPGLPLVVVALEDDTEHQIDLGIIGDVDLVVRTGGTYAGGPIPPPAPGVGAAPIATAGGSAYGVGTDVPFDVILSDGAVPPLGGNPLTGAEMDGRGVLVLAYPDLDGDGVIGPTTADGDADIEIERQEAFGLAARRIGLLSGGVASGDIGVSLGRPASLGGLGVVIAAAAATGIVPPLFVDSPWIATKLPYMPPLDIESFYSGDGVPNPDLIIELEHRGGDLWLPDPDEHLVGTPYATPLDGSEQTVDLLQSVSAEAGAVALASAIDLGTFVADGNRRIVPAVGPTGATMYVESLPVITLADDGAGNSASLQVFPADLLGNPADPPAGGMLVTLEVGAGLVIISPDGDGDPTQETIDFTTPNAVTVVVDDASGISGIMTDHVIAVVDGLPAGVLTVDLTGTEPPAAAAMNGDANLRQPPKVTGKDSLRFTAKLDDPALALDPAQTIVFTLAGPAGVIYSRTFPPGSFEPVNNGRVLRFRDPKEVTTNVVRPMLIRQINKADATHKVKVKVKKLDLADLAVAPGDIVATVEIGAKAFGTTIGCTLNAKGTVTRCGP